MHYNKKRPLWFVIFVLCYLQIATSQTSTKKPVLQSQQCQTDWYPYGWAQDISRSVSVPKKLFTFLELFYSKFRIKKCTETPVRSVSVIIGYMFLPFRVVHSPVFLSDSCLHLFLQSQLSVKKMEACAEGRSRYTVSEAILSYGSGIKRFDSDSEENLEEEDGIHCESE